MGRDADLLGNPAIKHEAIKRLDRALSSCDAALPSLAELERLAVEELALLAEAAQHVDDDQH